MLNYQRVHCNVQHLGWDEHHYHRFGGETPGFLFVPQGEASKKREKSREAGRSLAYILVSKLKTQKQVIYGDMTSMKI